MSFSTKCFAVLLMAIGFLGSAGFAQPGRKGPAKKEELKPAPDVIVFTNGDQLTGTLVRGVGSSVVFRSDMAGEVTVPLDKVRELHSTGSFAVLRKDVP